MPQVIGRDPHPRALLFQVDPEHLESVKACFPVSLEVSNHEDAVLDEWDLVVSDVGAPDWLPERLFAVVFGAGPMVAPADVGDFVVPGTYHLGRWYRSPARALVIPEDLPAPVARLVRDELAPFAEAAARTRGGNSVIVEGHNEPCEMCELFTPFGHFCIR